MEYLNLYEIYVLIAYNYKNENLGLHLKSLSLLLPWSSLFLGNLFCECCGLKLFFCTIWQLFFSWLVCFSLYTFHVCGTNCFLPMFSKLVSPVPSVALLISCWWWLYMFLSIGLALLVDVPRDLNITGM